MSAAANSSSSATGHPASTAISSSRSRVMGPAVKEYLTGMGYEDVKVSAAEQLSEKAYHLSLAIHTNLPDQFRGFNAAENAPEWYTESYVRLQRWIDLSLDMYRVCEAFFFFFLFFFSFF
jgi:hypothetical protein